MELTEELKKTPLQTLFMRIAIVNPIMKTLNYPQEKEPSERILSDSQTNIVELANAMQKLGHKITVFASDSFKPKKQSTSGAKIVYLKTRLRKLFFPAVLPFCPSLGKELKAGKFDAIIATDHYQLTTIQAALSKQKKTKLLVWQELDKEFSPFFAKLVQKTFNKTAFKSLEKNIDLFVPRSNSAKKFLKKICSNHKKISNPIPTPVNTGLFSEKCNSEGFVLDVTRLNKDRNLEFLLETATETKKNLPGIKFVVAGNGPEKHAFEKQLRLKNLSGNFQIIQVEKKKMPLLYSKSAVSIIHSRGGLFPFAALESMACSRPVISSFRGALEDLIVEGKNGFFAENPKQASERIIRLLKNKKMLSRFCKASRKKAVENFALEKMAKKFICTIEGLKQFGD